MPVRKRMVTGIAVGLAGVSAIAWTILNAPQATGRIVSGNVVYCGERETGQPWCMVRLDRDWRTFPVDVGVGGYPGQQLSLVEMRRRVTGQTQYLVRGLGKD
jgi:hypothetical protein